MKVMGSQPAGWPVVLVAATLLLFSCGDDDSNPVEPNNPPTEPIIDTAGGAPPDGSTDQPLDVVLRWICTDPDGDRLSYDVYFGTQAVPPIVAGNIADPSYKPIQVGFNVKYYWRIVVSDPDGAEVSSPIWSFRTGTSVK